jgi:hypothetical protein
MEVYSQQTSATALSFVPLSQKPAQSYSKFPLNSMKASPDNKNHFSMLSSAPESSILI